MPGIQSDRKRLLATKWGDSPVQLAEAVVDFLQKTIGHPTPTTAWKFIGGAVTYFQDTPGGPLQRVPNVTDFAKVWDKKARRPKPFYAGAEAIAHKLAGDFGIPTSSSDWLDRLENRVSAYFKLRSWLEGRQNPQRMSGRLLNNSQQRNTWVGDGFEQILHVLAERRVREAGIPGLEIRFKLQPQDIVGFQLRTGGGRQRFPVADVAVVNPLLRAVVSAKVGLRVDRTRGELDAAATLSRIRPEAYYLVVTSEYDTDFLRLLASEPSVARLYHVSKDYLLEFWRHIPGRTDEIPWIQSSLADLRDFFDDLLTIGREAI
jgi:hypothetical protein